MHGDDRGLILPWEVAPTQVVIAPISTGRQSAQTQSPAVCRDLKSRLASAKVRVELDTSDERPGAKFYKWEMKESHSAWRWGPGT